jgi:Herelleviridae exonuclease
MDPVRLVIEDFLCYSNADISFDEFSSAVVIAKKTGNDKISNGAGKSTIFSAIKYALFNRTDSSTLDQVIRHGTTKCRVSFDFRADGNTYRVIRSKPKATSTDIRLFQLEQDKWIEISNKTPSQTEAELAKIVKINYETFCNSVLFSHRDLFFGLASLRPADKKKALKEALQLNIYGKFEKIASKKSGDIVKEIEKTRTIIGILGDPKKDIQSFDCDLKNITNLIENKTDLLNKTKIKNSQEYEEYLILKSKFIELEKQANIANQRKEEITNEINKLSNISEDYNKKLLSLENAGMLISKEIEDITHYIGTHTHPDAQKYRLSLENLSASILDNKSKKQTLSKRFSELSIPLPTDSRCLNCRQTLTNEHRIECQKDIDKETVYVKNQIDVVVKKLQEEQMQETILKKTISDIDKSILEIANKKAIIELKNKELENKRALYTEYSSLSNDNQILFNAKLQELEEIKKSQNPQSISEYNQLKNNITAHKSIMLQSYKQIEDITKEITIHSNGRAVLEHKKSERIQDIEKIITLNNGILLLEDKYSLHQKVIQAFGSGGIPALIIHTILDDFQIETNQLLSQLKPGLQVQFLVIKERGDGDKDDTLDITYTLNGNELEYTMLSQAQKLLVSLCLKLGLASVIKKRLGTDIKLFLIDEADSALDDEGIEAFEAAVKRLQKDFKILIITHNRDLKEKFSHTILVEQDENLVSTAKVVNGW